MDTRERFNNIMHFKDVDRNLKWEMGYWSDTLKVWYESGLSQKYNEIHFAGEGIRGEAIPFDEVYSKRYRDRDVHEHLNMDIGMGCVSVNSGPQPLYEKIIFQEDEHFVVYQDEFGVIKKINLKESSVPKALEWPIKNLKDFELLIDKRFKTNIKERIPKDWDLRLANYKTRDYPLGIGGYPCGFYGFTRYLVGEENLLVWFYDNKQLIKTIMNFLADFWISLWDQVFKSVRVDFVLFWEDMAYRTSCLISPKMFREFITPCYKKITSFLKDWGVDVIFVDSDGNLNELIPLLFEAGVNGIYPIEIQANNDIVNIRKKYPELLLMGGINKLSIAKGKKYIDQELLKIPLLLEQGGYIPFLDHLVHPDISWDNFLYYRNALNKYI